MYHLTLVAMVI